MPDVDGLELLRHVRADDNFASVPVVSAPHPSLIHVQFLETSYLNAINHLRCKVALWFSRVWLGWHHAEISKFLRLASLSMTQMKRAMGVSTHIGQGFGYSAQPGAKSMGHIYGKFSNNVYPYLLSALHFC